MPSLTLGGDSLGTEERVTYLSCSYCFPSDPNASHSNLFIAVQQDAGPGSELSSKDSWAGSLSKGPSRLQAKNCPNFQLNLSSRPGTRSPGGRLLRLGVFPMHSSHSFHCTTPTPTASPPGCCRTGPHVPFTFGMLKAGVGTEKVPYWKSSLPLLSQIRPNTFIQTSLTTKSVRGGYVEKNNHLRVCEEDWAHRTQLNLHRRQWQK